jgi:hypothetical protein
MKVYRSEYWRLFLDGVDAQISQEVTENVKLGLVRLLQEGEYLGTDGHLTRVLLKIYLK